MTLRQNIIVGFLTLLILAAVANLGLAVAGLFMGGPYSSADNTAPSGTLHKLDFGHGDYIYNWDFKGHDGDFGEDDAIASNVDWAMRFIFKGNASVNTVKDKLDGLKNDPRITPNLGELISDIRISVGSKKSAFVDDGPERNIRFGRDISKWDKDGGLKDGELCDWNWGHMRVYANSVKDKNYNTKYKFYVVASIHRDHEGNKCRQRFRSLEADEDKWIKRIKDNLVNTTYSWTIQEENFNWKNSATKRFIDPDNAHEYESDGMGSTVTIPDDD